MTVARCLPLPMAALLMALPARAQEGALASLPHDLSPLGMFRQADPVVQGVMLGLALASVVTWTVLVVKLAELARASAALRRGAARIEAAESLRVALAGAEAPAPDARMLRAAARELNRSAGGARLGVGERVASHLAQVQARAARQMGRGTGLLATIGATAPFVGLFGTVWGIMNSFIGISRAQTTNLAVVAPGIAEALLATALGLVAAIPAVVIYNGFARAIGGYRLRLVAGGAHPSPLPHAHVVTTTTHKSLRGPRGGMILTNDAEIAKKINSAVFPGLQGGPLMHVIAAKAVAFGEALKPEFKGYAQQVVKNAQALSGVLIERGLAIVSGGTDSHLMLVDLRPKGVTGKATEAALGRAHITCNKNGVPFDPEKPFVT